MLAFSMIFTSLLVAVFSLVYYYVNVLRPRFIKLSKIPAVFPTYPVVGSSYHFKTGAAFRSQMLDFIICKNGPAGICLMWAGYHPIVAIWKPEFIETLLTSHEIKKSYLYTFMHPFLGNGLLTSHGETWHHHRKLLTPSFHFRILNDYIPVMNEHAEQLVKELEKYADTKTEFDIVPLVTIATMNIICEAAMGQTTGENDDRQRERVFKAAIDLAHHIQYRQNKIHLWPDFVFGLSETGRRSQQCLRIINEYTDNLIEERYRNFDRVAVESLMAEDGGGKRRPLPFLDSLIYSSENMTKLTAKEIKDEVNTFLFAGHDTTAASIAFTLYMLGRHPEAQRNVHDELDSIFGSSNRPVTLDDMNKMKYLTACIKEAMRIYPSVPLFARELNDDLRFGGYTVPKGSTVIVPTEAVHRDPSHFENPLEFKPERFFNETSKKLHTYAYIPFSAGQRNCIGQKYAQMEDKVVLAALLRCFTFKCDYTEDDMQLAAEIVLRPTKGIHFRVNYR